MRNAPRPIFVCYYIEIDFRGEALTLWDGASSVREKPKCQISGVRIARLISTRLRNFVVGADLR